MVKTTLYFPDNIHQELKLNSAKTGKTITALIIEALGYDLKDSKIITENISHSNVQGGVSFGSLDKKRGELNAEDYVG